MTSTQTSPPPASSSPGAADAGFRRHLGFWSLLAAGLGGIIGSGWLFSSLYAAQDAGPAALIAWVIGGGLMLLVALVLAELGMTKPEAGGLVRYPRYSHGGLAGGIVGWAMWLGYLGNPPTEAAGAVQYASAYLPGVYAGKQLTGAGVALAALLMAVFVALNWFGVSLFARSNTVVTVLKVVIPSAAAVLLLTSGFDADRLTAHGGFAPYGIGAALGTIATAGLVFAYTGFEAVVGLSGEARNARRTVPRAMVASIVIAVVLYLVLQLAFLGAVPDALLATGWHGVNLNSPFADLAMLLGLSWLSWTLIADSMISPSGSGIVYTATNSRNVFALSRNGFLPSWFTVVNPRWGVPTRALALNFVIGLAYLLPLPSWHSIISVTGSIAVLALQVGAVSLLVFRRAGLTGPDTRLRGMTVVAPVAYVVSTLVMFWVSWSKLSIAMLIIAVGLVLYAVTWIRAGRPGGELTAGVWLVVHLLVLTGFSAVGSFGGAGWIGAPWDSVAVAVVAVGLYVWGVAAGTAYLRARPDTVARLRREAAEASPPAESGSAGSGSAGSGSAGSGSAGSGTGEAVR